HALEPARSGGLDLRDRKVDVVDRKLGDAGPSPNRLRAEGGEPPGVREQTCGAELAREGRAAAFGDERTAIGEHHLGDDAVVFELFDTSLGVPLADGAAGDLVGLLVAAILVERLAREQEATLFGRLGA